MFIFTPTCINLKHGEEEPANDSDQTRSTAKLLATILHPVVDPRISPACQRSLDQLSVPANGQTIIYPWVAAVNTYLFLPRESFSGDVARELLIKSSNKRASINNDSSKGSCPGWLTISSSLSPSLSFPLSLFLAFSASRFSTIPRSVLANDITVVGGRG
mgnify:CR=1 FL=1